MPDKTREEYKLIDEKNKEMQPVWDRMDKDEKLYFLDPYKMMMLYPDDSKEAKDVANVTLNDPLTYAKKVIAILGRYERQTIVEGQGLADRKTTAIEDFIDDMAYAIDIRLISRGLLSMDAFIKEQACIRGRIGARAYVKLDKAGGLIADVVPVDTRYLPFEAGPEGMAWAAVVSTRSKSRLEAEYGDEIRDIKLSATNEVRDFWDSEKNVVFVEGTVIREQENPYGFVPVVVSLCPSGSTLSSDIAKQHEGESIFWSNRDLYAELNRTATVFQTVNLYSLFQALQRESDNLQAEVKPSASPWKPRSVHLVPKGSPYLPMPMADIKAAAKQFYAMLEARLQRGGLTALDYGNLTFPLSGVSIQSLLGARDDVLWPLLHAIAFYLQSLYQMVIRQCISFGAEIKLGRPGKESTYSVSDLDGEYSINYKFLLNSKEQRIADVALANAARGVFSMDTIRREIISCQDPDGEKAKWESEQAEQEDDVLRLFRRGLSLLYSAEKLKGDEKTIKQMEAKALMQRIRTVMAQRRALGQLSPMENKEAPTQAAPSELLPLLGGRARGKQVTEEEATNAEG